MASSKKPTKPRAKKADSQPAAIPTAVPTDSTKAGITGEDSLAMVDGSASGATKPASPEPFPTADIEGSKNAARLDTADGSTAGITQITDSTPFPTTATKEETKSEGSHTNSDGSAATPQITHSAGNIEMGEVASLSVVAEPQVVFSLPDSLPTARVRDNETKSQCRERLRQEARTAGMTRRDAISYAYRTVDQVWIPPVVEPEPEILEEPEAVAVEPEPDFRTHGSQTEEPAPQPIPSDQGVPGLGTIPESWPTLAANASLQAEIAWVSANRLLVRDGNGVDLSKALSPSPSYSALSWLETSILFPSKFADISVKATQNQEDEAQHVRREKLAIEEIRALLAEMMEE